jgi:hypothetical protein
VEGHVVVQGDRVDRGVDGAAREQGGQRAGEPDPVRRLGEVERLDAEAVPAQGQDTGVALGDREREHAQEALDAARPPAVERFEQHLGVGVGEEAVACALELGAQLAVVKQSC